MWWVTHNEHDAFAARGVHGQTIYIDPKAEMVIARYASHPVAGNAAIDPTSLPAYSTLAKYLMGKSDCADTSSIGLAADHLQAFPPPGREWCDTSCTCRSRETNLYTRSSLSWARQLRRIHTIGIFSPAGSKQKRIKGWGFTRYVVKDLGTIAGTRMAVPSNTPEAARFITLGGEPYFIRYNSQLPIVVYTPEGAEVRYRIWSPMGKTEAIPQG